MLIGRNFAKQMYVFSDLAVETALVEASYHPASTAFMDTNGYDHFAFLIKFGTLADALTFALYQDTSATVTGSVKAISGASQVCTATDDNKWMSIECPVAALDTANSFRYVTCKVSGVSGSNYAAILGMLYRARNTPVTQHANYLYSVIVGG